MRTPRKVLLLAALLVSDCAPNGNTNAGTTASGGAGGRAADPSRPTGTGGAATGTGGGPAGRGGTAAGTGGGLAGMGGASTGTDGGLAATGGVATGMGGGPAGGAATGTGGNALGGHAGSGDADQAGALGAYPFAPSTVTRGGTMTFREVGAAGWWPRRIDRDPGDPACDYKDGTDTWGAHCCMTKHETSSTTLSPFDEEMTLIVKAIDIKQLAVYQGSPSAPSASWQRITAWDRRNPRAENLWFTQQGNGSTQFSGDLTKNDCVGYVMQESMFDCDDGRDYFCPNDPGVLHRGFSGSKLVVFLGSMSFDDRQVAACSGSGTGHPGPWVAFVASELIRDGGRKWNGACNCYSKTGTVGDGCGEINVFEVVMDGNEYSNREFASTGVRSFQAGHVGGAVCGASCDRGAFAADVDVVDACSKTAYAKGPEIVVGGATQGCPVWRRPDGDRYFFLLLDQAERTIQAGIVHPASIPAAASGVLPALPASLPRATIDALLRLRLPS